MERRLAAILAADVVGYSRLVHADEEGTLRTLSAYREVIDGLVAAHRGRIFGTAGDSVIAEFASPVEAVRCATEVQQELGKRNADVPEDRRMEFRIGVNLGDVVVEGDDLLGDGVNVAARLQELADAGGICISRAARDQVRDKLDVVLDDMGEVEVKNIVRPVRAFRVIWDGETPDRRAATTGRVSRRWLAVAAALVMTVGAAAVVAWFRPWAPDVEPASVERMAYPLPDKPSIAVLPFTNMSDDPGQDYFADGITDDLITDLSKVSGLFVIARNSTFVYKGRAMEIHQVAEDLGVRYVLEGSVRRAGGQVRINAQLIDATTGGHLWAERYDGSMADVFSLQDNVTKQIVTALAVTLTDNEQNELAETETTNPQAHDAFLLGWTHYRLRTPEDFVKAVSYFERAVELDPGYSRAYAAIGATYWASWVRGWDDALGIQSMFGAWDQADEYLERAAEAPVPLMHQIKSAMAYTSGKHQAALDHAELALALDVNDPDSHIAMAEALIFAGRAEEAVNFAEKAIRLDPRRPAFYFATLGLARYGLGQFEEAAKLLERAVFFNPEICSRGKGGHLIPLVAAYGQLGRLKKAEKALAQVNRVRKCGVYTLQDARSWWPFREDDDLDRLVNGLRMAGVSE